MSFLRAVRSVVRPAAQRLLAAPAAPCGARALGRHAYYVASSATRSFAAEVGFLDRGDVTERVLDVVRKFEKVEPEKVKASSHFVNDLGLDSLDTVELVMAFEDEFAIEIPDDDAEKILSCEDAVTYVAGNVNAK